MDVIYGNSIMSRRGYLKQYINKINLFMECVWKTYGDRSKHHRLFNLAPRTVNHCNYDINSTTSTTLTTNEVVAIVICTACIHF